MALSQLRYKQSTRQFPQQTTGADLAFALSSFHRIKDQLKAERRVSRQKQLRIQQLEKDIDALNNSRHTIQTAIESKASASADQYIQATKTQMHTLTHTTQVQLAEITHLRALLNEQHTASTLTIDANRYETEKLRDTLESVNNQLKEIREVNELALEKVKRCDFETRKNQRVMQTLKEKNIEMKQEKKKLQIETSEVRKDHKMLLIESKKNEDHHRTLELQWTLESEQLTQGLERCRKEALLVVGQTQEEERNKTNVIRNEQNNSLTVLSNLLQEERMKLEEVAVELANEKRRVRALEYEMEELRYNNRNSSVITTPQAPSVNDLRSSDMLNGFMQAVEEEKDDHEVDQDEDKEDDKIEIIQQQQQPQSEYYQKALDSVAHLVIDSQASMTSSRIQLQSLKNSFIELKEGR